MPDNAGDNPMVLADAHAHLFRSPGWASIVPGAAQAVQRDEVALYGALAQHHGVRLLLAVGYEGDGWCRDNNAFLAEVAERVPFVRPVAYFSSPAQLNLEHLEHWAARGFIGVSLYLFNDEATAELAGVPDAVWDWMISRRWLISVNSKGHHWTGWQPVLQRFPDLRLLVAHLGLPPAVAQTPRMEVARQAMEPVLSLASFPHVYVKLSGFYALTVPGHDYPHPAAWPYVRALLDRYTARRLLWGSDFAPSLDHLSFPQTFGLFEHIPFLDTDARRGILGENLARLIRDVGERHSHL